MKKIIFFSLVLCSVISMSFIPSKRPMYKLSQEEISKLDFDLVNKTGYTISEIFVSPTSEKDWGEDIMGKDMLTNGETVSITFDREETAKKWDLYVTWDGYSAEEDVYWTGFELAKIEEISLFYDHKTGKTWAETK
jgi:hypothetical protein